MGGVLSLGDSEFFWGVLGKGLKPIACCSPLANLPVPSIPKPAELAHNPRCLKPGNAATASLLPCGSPMHVGAGGSSLPTHQKPSASGNSLLVKGLRLGFRSVKGFCRDFFAVQHKVLSASIL